MRETGRVSASDIVDVERGHDAAWTGGAGTDAVLRPEPALEPARATPSASPELLFRGESTFAHPVVLVDPRPATLVAVWSLRRHGTPLHVVASRWLEASLWARGVRRHRLPNLAERPLAWSTRLLELAAHLEPRPLLIPCSRPARDLLRQARSMLQPHYELAHVEPLDLHGYEAEDFRTEKALRRTVLRGEPAFEVQLTLDAAGGCTGACVFAWVAAVPPTVLVTSVDGDEVLERSIAWLQERQVRGYARLIWAPDRFGRIDLQAAGTIPGTTWALAVEDGLDFPALWYASLAGFDVEPRRAERRLARQFTIAKPGFHEEALPLVPLRVPWSRHDPLPCVAGMLAALCRR